MEASESGGFGLTVMVSVAYPVTSENCYFGVNPPNEGRRKMRSILAIAMAFLLAPSIALADKTKSSPAKDTPKESISINYGKIDYTYRTNNPKPNSGVNVRSAPRSGTRH
jgi:hypothetical protein